MKCRLICAADTVGAFAISQPAYASLPVSFEVIGRVTDENFTGEGHMFSILVKSEKRIGDVRKTIARPSAAFRSNDAQPFG